MKAPKSKLRRHRKGLKDIFLEVLFLDWHIDFWCERDTSPMALECEVHRNIEKSTCNLYTQNINPLRKMSSLYRDIPLPWKKSQTSWRLPSPLCICSTQIPPHYGLRGCPIKKQKCLKKSGMVPKRQEWWQGIWNIIFFCQSLKIIQIFRLLSVILRYSAI